MSIVDFFALAFGALLIIWAIVWIAFAIAFVFRRMD